MEMPEEHVSDLLAGYALGCLDEEERINVSRHLGRCAQCRAELSAQQETVDLLAFSGPMLTPPPDLKQKVLNSVKYNHALLSKREPVDKKTPSIPGVLRSFFSNPLSLALGGLALLLVVVLAVNNLLLIQQNQDLQAHLSASQMHVVTLASTSNAPQAVGYMMVFANEKYGTLTIHNAPGLDSTHQYQLWLVKDGKRFNGGVFSVNEDGYGVLQISADLPLETYQSFGVTIEPFGGSAAPTGKKVFGSKS